MPFGTITVNSQTFQPRNPGVYSLSTLSFGQPKNEFRLRGGVKGKDGSFRASVTRLREKVRVDGVTVDNLIITLNVTAPTAFSSAEIDAAVLEISDFCTVDNITRLLAGES